MLVMSSPDGNFQQPLIRATMAHLTYGLQDLLPVMPVSCKAAFNFLQASEKKSG